MSERRLWIDVEDLFEYARTNARPSGIQRVAFEIQHALEQDEQWAHRLSYVRHTVDGLGLRVVPREQVDELYRRLTAPPAHRGAPTPVMSASEPTAPSRLRQAALRLPAPVRVPLGSLLRDQRQALQHGITLSKGVGAAGRDLARQWRSRRSEEDAPSEVFAPQPGDIFLALGAPWSHGTYGALLKRCREQHGMTTGLLIYDLIPLLWPEWCRPGLSRIFRRWYDEVIPECDLLFAISDATRADVERYAHNSGLALRSPVQVIPMGTSFSDANRHIGASPLGMSPSEYVLTVGTIEARKNHALLFRVWRRLLRERPPSTVPCLVFAGRRGWLVEDLLQQIRNSNFLDGHLVIVDGPSDEEINALYRGALFTVFPSFYEGWGLPVTESHGLGKVCATSDAASLAEAAGNFAPRFDPDNATQALKVISALIDNPDELRTREAALRAQFTPVPWSSAAKIISEKLSSF
ncbi:glycosyltransferase family 4 protein [Kozakia baliensis]|uniref:Uncharacterized protein n=1 Tax=Kozakia baliensis TaxID=153496 RepID=A0A1D8URB1_9PROT|nr:glycosyltransferase family 1 protein [Kozakia baliensis]AOX16146.1 hypothetical protein A0U89_02305 [Kozakia baliensis]GBR23348.1 glycosyltransferase [Kozakia baliensis NRIC 0488]GEL65032.1 hypothetical protein KBA01_23180 [Kozakia baliensis]